MNKSKHKKLLYIYGFLTAFIMLAIFLMSAQDGNESGSLSSGFLKSIIGAVLSKILPSLTDKGFDYDIRKYAHMTEYFCLAVSSFLFAAELFRFRKKRLLLSPVSAWLFSFLYACSDEFHQLFVPGRAGRFTDVMIDSVGISSAVILMLLIFLINNLRLRHSGSHGENNT